MQYHDRTVPEYAAEVLARLGAAIEFSDRHPAGDVNLGESGVQDSDLEHLIFSPGFTSLQLDRTGISDAGLAFVGDMRNLESLSLHQTPITNAGLAELGGLLNLSELSIGADPG